MKFETKKRKQFEEVKDWASKARKHFHEHGPVQMSTAFYTLIALEQLIKYLEMKEGE